MFDGKDKYSWFTDSPADLFNQLLRRKYRGYNIYAHNLGKFDLIFIHSYLADLRKKYDINILKRDSKIISITISNWKKNISITLKDSLLLFDSNEESSSLANLCLQFNVDTPKGIEPIFQGDINSYYYQSDISHYTKEVEIIKDLDLWKSKVQLYCETDCIALYQVLVKFINLIYNE